jgi:hypothetical protein
MVTKTALWKPRYQLLDREWTKKWSLPQNGRRSNVASLKVFGSPAIRIDGYDAIRMAPALPSSQSLRLQ